MSSYLLQNSTMSRIRWTLPVSPKPVTGSCARYACSYFSKASSLWGSVSPHPEHVRETLSTRTCRPSKPSISRLLWRTQKLLNPDYQMEEQEWNEYFVRRRQLRAVQSIKASVSHTGEMRKPSQKRMELSDRVLARSSQLSSLDIGMLCVRTVRRLGL